MTESQIIDMLTSPVQQCRVRNGRIQVKRHRPISDAGHDSGRSWGDWITVAVAPRRCARGRTGISMQGDALQMPCEGDRGPNQRDYGAAISAWRMLSEG